MPSWRPARVGAMVHREVAERLRTDIKDPLLPMVSITRVEVSKDLGRAVVWFLPLGGGVPDGEAMSALGRAARALRGPVGRALGLRTAPELEFRHDLQHEEAMRVAGLLAQLEAERREREEEGP